MCHHYLIPLLSQIPLDSSLFKKDTSHMGPPDSSDRMDTSENGDSSKENVDPLLQDLQVTKFLIFPLNTSYSVYPLDIVTV